MKIAFIGLGNMGGAMAANLVKAGHEVRAFDLSEPALAAARGAGCTTFATARQACANAEVVVSMLPNGQIVKQVYRDEVIGHAPEGALLIDCSTIDVATARETALAAEAGGYQMVDAPVSGGIAAANAGTLTFMVGGSDTAFGRCEPVLQAMGKAVIHAGGAGNGQAAKICNNMLLGIHMIGTCEAFVMARKLGLDPQSPADNSYQGGFATALMLKDLRLAMAAAKSVGADVAIGAKALYAAFAEAGHSEQDFSAFATSLG